MLIGIRRVCSAGRFSAGRFCSCRGRCREVTVAL